MVILSEITRNNYNNIGYMDGKLETTLKLIGQQENTVLIVNSVKGSLVGKLGKLTHGKAEYRRPLLNVYLSADLKKNKLRLDGERSKGIVSGYDVFSTVSDLLSGSQSSQSHKYGLSLFKEADNKRDCHATGVSQSMCPCVI